jgi:Co/Zn/Cd efflux system component
MRDQGGYLESINDIPEPHAFTMQLRIGQGDYSAFFEEHEHADGAANRDNNMRAGIIHAPGRCRRLCACKLSACCWLGFGWLWMDPLAGIIGAGVIASWSYGLIGDTGSILLDMIPDPRMADNLRQTLESDGDKLADLHLWRLGPGHLGAIISVSRRQSRDAQFYRTRLARFKSLSHLTVEVLHQS